MLIRGYEMNGWASIASNKLRMFVSILMCCAQLTRVHNLIVEALLIYLPTRGNEQILIDTRRYD